MLKKLEQFWYWRAITLGGFILNLLVFLFVCFSWFFFGYLSPHPPPSLQDRTLSDVLTQYFTVFTPHVLFGVGGTWALMSEAFVRWTKGLFFGLILSYVLVPCITFALLFVFADMAHSGNMKADLQGYWFLTSFYITIYWIIRSSFKWFLCQVNSAFHDPASRL